MQPETFTVLFNESIPFLSKEWKNKYAKLLDDEHWSIIRERVYTFAFKNKIDHNPLPIFDEEIIADYPKHYQHFEKIKSIVEKNEPEKAQFIANVSFGYKKLIMRKLYSIYC